MELVQGKVGPVYYADVLQAQRHTLHALSLPTLRSFVSADVLAALDVLTHPFYLCLQVAKVLVLTGMEACFVFLVSAAWDSDLGLAKDVLECGIFGCYAGATNDATKSANFKYNYRVGVGVCLFAPALAMCVYIFLLVLRVGADVNVADAVAGLGVCPKSFYFTAADETCILLC